ncbi:hypothetical protein GCM10010431_43600 [Streptomyces kunmingensis]
MAENLVDCAQSCAPDLAFRLLLSTLHGSWLSEPYGAFRLSADQYGRLERLGSAFRYGEFVVSDYKYLVAEGE